jgi:hypothetical protein
VGTGRPDGGSPHKITQLLNKAATAYKNAGDAPKALEIWSRIIAEYKGTAACADALCQVADNVSDTTQKEKYLNQASTDFAGTEGAYTADLALAELYETTSRLFEAREALVRAYDFPQLTADDAEDLENRMIQYNQSLLFGKTETPDTELYKVVPGDSLARIAKNRKIDIGVIKAMNHLKDNNIYVGQMLKLGTGEWSLLVDKSRFVLVVMYENSAVKRYNVAVGMNDQTPVGDFTVYSKLEDPVYYKKEGGKTRTIQPGDPENALGSRWMGFAEPWTSYGIHGTLEPDSIGTAASQGCIRMRNEEVEELFEWVPRGMKVVIQN